MVCSGRLSGKLELESSGNGLGSGFPIFTKFREGYIRVSQTPVSSAAPGGGANILIAEPTPAFLTQRFWVELETLHFFQRKPGWGSTAGNGLNRSLWAASKQVKCKITEVGLTGSGLQGTGRALLAAPLTADSLRSRLCRSLTAFPSAAPLNSGSLPMVDRPSPSWLPIQIST